MDIDLPRFTVSEVALAAELSANTLRSWFQRGYISLLPVDQRAGASGYPRFLSMRSALRIAVAARLVDQGISPAKAALAAHVWTDQGQKDLLDPDQPVCPPAGLFETPSTVLCYFSDGTALVRHAPPTLPWQSLFTTYIPFSMIHREMTAVHLDRVYKTIVYSLDPTSRVV